MVEGGVVGIAPRIEPWHPGSDARLDGHGQACQRRVASLAIGGEPRGTSNVRSTMSRESDGAASAAMRRRPGPGARVRCCNESKSYVSPPEFAEVLGGETGHDGVAAPKRTSSVPSSVTTRPPTADGSMARPRSTGISRRTGPDG